MPVSLLTEDGKLYLVAGDHEPLNKKLAPLAVNAPQLKVVPMMIKIMKVAASG